jgi:mono/diheme cytochrome c family protein
MRMGRPVVAVAVLALGIIGGILGWSQGSTAKTAVEGKQKPDVRIERGKAVYVQYCAHCHGTEG